MTERGVGAIVERLVARGVLGRSRDGFRGAAVFDVLPLLRAVRFAVPGDGKDVPVTRGEARSLLDVVGTPREGNDVPRERNVDAREGNVLPEFEPGAAVERESREGVLPLATEDAGRRAVRDALRRLTAGGKAG
jgi:hypothetical protein